MSETTSRVLQLLGLLQSRRVWTGEELAERLAVTTRSVRRDVERLRDLGYPVHASKGHGGGYQLGADLASYVRHSISASPYRYVARVRYRAPEHVVAQHFSPASANRRCAR